MQLAAVSQSYPRKLKSKSFLPTSVRLLTLNRIKTTDVAKLQNEYAKLVEGLQESISDESDTDGFMGNPCMSLSFSLYFSGFLTGCAGSQPPSLLVTVSGTVIHGRNAPPASSKSVDAQPRVFSQTFMLVPDPTAAPTKSGEIGKYYVNADAMRFVG